MEAKPNKAHYALVDLEEKYNVQLITQNIDDLHERAGSKNVLHLHGEIVKSRSSVDVSLVYNINGDEIKLGEKCELGSQLRPHIVWFGEMVPEMETAYSISEKADIFIVIGTYFLCIIFIYRKESCALRICYRQTRCTKVFLTTST